MKESNITLDYVFVPIGGGGLASGVGLYFKYASSSTKVIGVEPAGALSVAALEPCREMISGHNVCCVLSGSNNDVARINEIQRRANWHTDNM